MKSLYICFFFLGSFLAHTALRAQCPNDNSLSFSPPTNMTPAGAGQTVTNCCVWGGEYVEVNVVSGNNYTFSTCLNNSYDTHLTLRRASDGVLLAANDNGCATNRSTITWTASMTGLARLLVDQSSTCATNGTNTEVRVTLNTVAPLIWGHLDATPQRNGVMLSWSTQVEVGVQSFIVERATDGATFERIAVLPATGNSDKQVEYNWLDAAPQPGLNYYRLSELSLNGESTLHPQIQMVSVENGTLQDGINIFPQPATNRIQVQARVAPGIHLTIHIYDLSGKCMQTHELDPAVSYLSEAIPLQHLATGAYILEMRQGNAVARQKLNVLGEQ